MPGTLYIVATPIGNLEDVTLRALRILKEVDMIACEDTRHTRKLLSHFDIHVPTTSYFQGNEKQKLQSTIELLTAGKNVALVSDAGTPAISDPGYRLVVAAIEHHMNVIPIPGPSALVTALCAAGLPTDRFLFIGFLPEKEGKRRKLLQSLVERSETLIFYVSPYKVSRVLSECLDVFGNRNAVVARELSKIHEEFVRKPLSELISNSEKTIFKGEITLLLQGKL